MSKQKPEYDIEIQNENDQPWYKYNFTIYRDVDMEIDKFRTHFRAIGHIRAIMVCEIDKYLMRFVK